MVRDIKVIKKMMPNIGEFLSFKTQKLNQAQPFIKIKNNCCQVLKNVISFHLF